MKKIKKNPDEVNSYFLACEFKPESPLFSVIDPFVYDIKPAYIFGSLGVIAYNPDSYAIIDIDDDGPPLMGYLMTITNPETVTLLDKMKGYNGPEFFSTHNKILTRCYTDIDKWKKAWCYTLSTKVVDYYQKIEQIEFGLTNEEDEKLVELLEKIGGDI